MDKGIIINNNLLYFKGKVYILTGKIRDLIVSQYHDPVIYKYPGVKKTLEYITRIFYFPNIKKRTKDYIARYTDYN